MSVGELVTAVLILVGAVVMLASAMRTRRVVALIGERRFARHWRTLLIMMVFFLLGYVATIGLVVGKLGHIVQIMTGVIFMAGALFVLIVVQLGYLTIHDLDQFATSLEAQVQARTAELRDQAEALARANAELEEKAQALAQAHAAVEVKAAALGRANTELQIHRERLEETVRSRTAELRTQNQRLERVNEFTRLTVEHTIRMLKQNSSAFDVLYYMQEAHEQFERIN